MSVRTYYINVYGLTCHKVISVRLFPAWWRSSGLTRVGPELAALALPPNFCSFGSSWELGAGRCLEWHWCHWEWHQAFDLLGCPLNDWGAFGASPSDFWQGFGGSWGNIKAFPSEVLRSQVAPSLSCLVSPLDAFGPTKAMKVWWRLGLQKRGSVGVNGLKYPGARLGSFQPIHNFSSRDRGVYTKDMP
ncbi:hypothetical protein AMTR_s00047p00082760 [Amborella trichopoda]|uniref:Uncharacterized protein n=1 Tax=Amborella trichopoda TaxID=13333 RepID=U5D8J2_AMBTC|nr:hypothetical protein AMTR_s00047p00082760 [Amborella trichopoda]